MLDWSYRDYLQQRMSDTKVITVMLPETFLFPLGAFAAGVGRQSRQRVGRV